MSLKTRLDKAAAQVTRLRCDACRGRSGYVLIFEDAGALPAWEGPVLADVDPCPQCGWQPDVIRVRYVDDWRQHAGLRRDINTEADRVAAERGIPKPDLLAEIDSMFAEWRQ